MIKLRHFLAMAAVSGTFLATPADSAAQFGRNKVQYEPRVFQIVRTDHFDVYFYEEERDAAVDAARMAERIYGRLSSAR